jgi:hypothetical protein
MKDRVIGLIAGEGEIPLLFAKEIRKCGGEVVAIAVSDMYDRNLPKYVKKFYKFPLGEIDRIIRSLQKEELKEVIMLGKVRKNLLFESNKKFDKRASNLLGRLKNRSDPSIMREIILEIEGEGIKVLKQTSYLSHLVVERGLLTQAEPDAVTWDDINFAVKMARAVANFGIGQTVVVKNLVVLSVEGIEGTDDAILRGGKLGGGEVVVAKMAGEEKDERFDLPTIGLYTVEAMIKVKGKALVVEAGKTFLLNRTQVIEKANKAKLSILGI